MRVALIHNPRGGSATDADLDRIVAMLAPHARLDVHVVDDHSGPRALAHRAVADGAELLVASGGDGTVAAVADAAVANDVPLGILPRGTANSIAGHLGIPADLETACRIALHGDERRIDTAKVEGRTMVLMATTGLHATAVTSAAPERKRALGPLAYVIEGLGQVGNEPPFEVVVEDGAGRFSCEASSVTVANLAPPTTVLAHGAGALVEDDGLLDVTIVSMRSLGEALATGLHLAAHAWTETPADRENIVHFRTPAVRVSTSEPKALMIDGESAGETPFSAEAVPRSLRVRVPRA